MKSVAIVLCGFFFSSVSFASGAKFEEPQYPLSFLKEENISSVWSEWEKDIDPAAFQQANIDILQFRELVFRAEALQKEMFECAGDDLNLLRTSYINMEFCESATKNQRMVEALRELSSDLGAFLVTTDFAPHFEWSAEGEKKLFIDLYSELRKETQQAHLPMGTLFVQLLLEHISSKPIFPGFSGDKAFWRRLAKVSAESVDEIHEENNKIFHQYLVELQEEYGEDAWKSQALGAHKPDLLDPSDDNQATEVLVNMVKISSNAMNILGYRRPECHLLGFFPYSAAAVTGNLKPLYLFIERPEIKGATYLNIRNRISVVGYCSYFMNLEGLQPERIQDQSIKFFRKLHKEKMR